MRRNSVWHRNRLSGIVIMVVLAGCAQHTSQSTDVTDKDADRVFDQANSDPRSGLGALDIERIGLGSYWNTLDKNGDGQVSRKEFRQRFREPAFQRQVLEKAQASNIATSEEAVSSSWRLPPQPPSQIWRSGATTPPATLSTPSAAAWGVAPSVDSSGQEASDRQDTQENPADDSVQDVMSP